MNKVLVLFADGFEEVEALTVVDYLRRADIDARMVSINETKNVKGAHGVEVVAEKTLEDIKELVNFRGIVIPGGLPGATNLRDDKRVIDLVRKFYDNNKLVASICAGPAVLEKAGILSGKKATCYPGFEEQIKSAVIKDDLVVKDGNIITAKGPAATVYFALRIIEELAGQEKAKEVRKGILLDIVEKKIR